MDHSRILPITFCWTRMGTEAGQPLNAIIERKEKERESGDGVFFWGIGTALGQKIWEFIDSGLQPLTLFSPMKAKPKKIDIEPKTVSIWSAYIDRCGRKHPVPDYAYVTSRGCVNGRTKDKHYALICHKNSPLLGEEIPPVDWARMKNYKGDTPLGYSQVTAIVDYKDSSLPEEKNYEVSFIAELVSPFYVTLVDPIELPC